LIMLIKSRQRTSACNVRTACSNAAGDAAVQQMP
jgi:hypothetical protein